MFDKIHCRVAAGLRIMLFRFYRRIMQRPGIRDESRPLLSAIELWTKIRLFLENIRDVFQGNRRVSGGRQFAVQVFG